MIADIDFDGHFTVVNLKGYLDFENSKPVGSLLEEIYSKNQAANVIINMKELEFVGSSGIANFVKLLRGYNSQSIKPAYCGMKSEFLKIFRVFEQQASFTVCESVDEAKQVIKYKQFIVG